MTNKKIVGLPTIVTDRLRIVLDSNLRNFYGIGRIDTVLMVMEDHVLHVYPSSQTISNAKTKSISAGRFNLPSIWAKNNNINVGDYVYLISTDEGMLIYPSALEV